MPNVTDIAWAGGLFEGEGSITTSGKNNGARLKLSLASTDKDVVERFHSIVGAGTINGPYVAKLSTKPFYQWRVSTRGGALNVMHLLLPWLGERRVARWNEVSYAT